MTCSTSTAFVIFQSWTATFLFFFFGNIHPTHSFSTFYRSHGHQHVHYQQLHHQNPIQRQEQKRYGTSSFHRNNPISFLFHTRQQQSTLSTSSITTTSSSTLVLYDNSNNNDYTTPSTTNHLNNTKQNEPLVLDWNLYSVLSSDPSMEARLIPLMQVYDAVTQTVATTSSSSSSSSSSPILGRDSRKDSNAFGKVQSLSYNGPPLPNSIAPYKMFVRDYTKDMGHDGRFTVFGDVPHSNTYGGRNVSNASNVPSVTVPTLQSDVVLSMDNPLAFLRDELSYNNARSKVKDTTTTTTTSTTTTAITTASSMKQNDNSETVVYIPGLHTFHNPQQTKNIHSYYSHNTTDNESSLSSSSSSTTTATTTISHPINNHTQRSSSEQVKYISQVLDGIPIAQLHTGTHIDQGDWDIELTSDTLNCLLSFDLLSDHFKDNLSCILSSTSKSTGTDIDTGSDSSGGSDSSDSSDSSGTSMLGTDIPKKATYRLRARDLDILHTALSRTSDTIALSRSLGDEYLGSDTRGLKDTLIRLIDVAVRSVRQVEQISTSTSTSSVSSAKGMSSSASSFPHLVLMTYSATSNVLAAALSEWKKRVTTSIEDSHRSHLPNEEDARTLCSDGVGVGMDESESSGRYVLKRKVFTEEEAELLLHKALTVVTFSSLSQRFVDGPAYVHVSMIDDPLVSSLGVTNLNSKSVGGKDAVTLQGLSPYLMNDENDENSNDKTSFLYKNDTHNIDACVIQYLSLICKINGITSFRELYNEGVSDSDSKKLDISTSLFAMDYKSVGQLIIPPHMDCELIPAMVRATGGERWLWNPSLQLGEGGVEGLDSPLPSLEYAQAEIENQLGYNSYDEIVENCCR